VGLPFDVVYSATKAGQIAATHALRSEYRGSGVRFSVVCPGFVRESGMWYDNAGRKGVKTSPILGSTTPDKVAAAVVKAIRENRPEINVNSPPSRLLLTVGETSPRLREFALRVFGLRRILQAGAEANGQL
jgi:short-subunit dehydrogenase